MSLCAQALAQHKTKLQRTIHKFFGSIVQLSVAVWDQCLARLQSELPAQQFNTWIRPLRVDGQGGILRLLAPNRFVLDWVNDKFLHRIKEIAAENGNTLVELGVISRQEAAFTRADSLSNGPSSRDCANGNDTQGNGFHPDQHSNNSPQQLARNPSSSASPHAYGGSNNNHQDRLDQSINHFDFNERGFPQDLSNSAMPFGDDGAVNTTMQRNVIVDETSGMGGRIVDQQGHSNRRIAKEDIEGGLTHRSNLNTSFTFANFVEGKSNQLGLAAATQVAENPGGSYNPLFIYGGVGLGKTHLMHAVGNALMVRRPNAKVIYLHSERFVADMVKALQLNAINDFKRYYRSVDALLIDDIQFFAGKERSQEEFFHTFNALLEGGQQIILTCDRYPKEITGLEERLKSRFGWGLTVAIEPPELETRVAILMKKAHQAAMELPHDAAFFIGQRIRSNVRELEGALKRVIANAHFTGRAISIDLVRESLKDLLALQDRLVSIDNIQRVVAEYYKIKVSDLHSKRRSRSVARPRQVAMYLAKELTNHSLPEIGESFGGRDHTTVLHACRKIKELLESDADIREDVKNLLRTLTT